MALCALGAGIAPAVAEPVSPQEREQEITSSDWWPADPDARRIFDPVSANHREEGGTPLTSAASPTVSGVLTLLRFGTTRPVEFGLIRFWRKADAGSFELVYQTFDIGNNGEFSASVPAGVYRIEFIGYRTARTYWQNQPNFFVADELVLSDDMSQDLGTVVVEPNELGFNRISGNDRFATAAALTTSLFDGSSRAPVIYIADGLSFADALSAGPAAAAQGGALLPVLTNGIPQVIRNELARLNPERIVIVGGTGAISTAVEIQLASYVDSPNDIDRVSGPDRYATSRAIVLDAFGESGLNAIFFATGRNFPDALAAGPAAANLGGAVLLVDGAMTSLPSATQTLIGSFGVADTYIAGGDGAIRPELEQAINDASASAQPALRLSGDNRIETANRINAQAFAMNQTYPDFAFLANSNGFADALAAGPVAAAFGAPLYLTTESCLNAQVYYDLAGLIVSELFLVGGAGVLRDDVAFGPLC
ncbi:MAG: hypothetical protein C0444_00640 [Microbacterium sp.]|nr:hypothetical protein [Microbacterium sp.]MBA4346894.1 hypothetical protein [Microbacterium sp.]